MVESEQPSEDFLFGEIGFHKVSPAVGGEDGCVERAVASHSGRWL